MAIEIPPWLNLNITQAPATYLQGYGQGASAGSAATSAVQRDEALAAQREQAEALNDIRRQEMQLKADEFGLQLKERQKKAEREAQDAAIQLEGQQQYQKDIDAGMDPIKALAKNAGKMLHNHPQNVAQALRLGQTPQPGWTPGGREFMTTPGGGVHFPPGATAREPFTPDMSHVPPGSHLIQTGPNRWQLVPDSQFGGRQRAEMQDLVRQRDALTKVWVGFMNPAIEEKDKPPGFKEAMAKIEAFNKQIRGVYKGDQNATGAPTPGMIKKGYQFKGGDPAKPENWEKVEPGKLDESIAPGEEEAIGQDLTDEEE